MKLFKKSLTIVFFLVTCCASLVWAQSPVSSSSPLRCEVQGGGSIECAYFGMPDGNFYFNPLMLEGVAFNRSGFTLKSKGELKLIKGDPKTGKIVEIPFYVRLRRYGIIILHPCGEGVMYSRVEISSILKNAQNGDELIVEPVNKEDWPARQIVKIGPGC